MKLIRGLHFPKLSTSCVLTIGNFDGVHLAHQAILQQVITQAKQHDAVSMVVIFEPTPHEFFSGEKAPARLTNLREKLMMFRELGIDYVWLLKFNQQLANLSGTEFVEQILLTHIKLAELIVGDDFQFGKNRSGDFKLLEQFATKHGFVLQRTHEIAQQEVRVSSTRVRQLLAAGDFTAAAQLLGRPYTITGRVMHGAKRGRQLGFPTANISLKRKVVPLHGVYVVRVNNEYNGIANIGTRPTVDGTRTVLEVHLFDFEGNLYGQMVQVEFLQKIRDEQRFASLDELKGQIAKDLIFAQQFVATTVLK